jgi:hypothetical protein
MASLKVDAHLPDEVGGKIRATPMRLKAAVVAGVGILQEALITPNTGYGWTSAVEKFGFRDGRHVRRRQALPKGRCRLNPRGRRQAHCTFRERRRRGWSSHRRWDLGRHPVQNLWEGPHPESGFRAHGPGCRQAFSTADCACECAGAPPQPVHSRPPDNPANRSAGAIRLFAIRSGTRLWRCGTAKW